MDKLLVAIVLYVIFILFLMVQLLIYSSTEFTIQKKFLEHFLVICLGLAFFFCFVF